MNQRLILGPDMTDQFYSRGRFGNMHKYRTHSTKRKPRLNMLFKVRPHIWRANLVGLPPPLMVLKHPEARQQNHASMSLDQILVQKQQSDAAAQYRAEAQGSVSGSGRSVAEKPRSVNLSTLTTAERAALRHFEKGTDVTQLSPLDAEHPQQNRPIPVYATGIAHRLFPDQTRSGFHSLSLTQGGRFMGRGWKNFNLKHHMVGGNHRL